MISTMKENEDIVVICNPHQISFFENEFSSHHSRNIRKSWVNDLAAFYKCAANFSIFNPPIIIEADLNWLGVLTPHFFGFDLLGELRRNFLIRSPVIVVSVLSKIDFQDLKSSDLKYSLLDSLGTAFLQAPFISSDIEEILNSSKQISDSELDKVVENYCEPHKAWSKASHDLGNWVPKSDDRASDIRLLFDKWKRPINRYWPDCFEPFSDLERLLTLNVKGRSLEEKLKALENFDAQLLETETGVNVPRSDHSDTELPRCPPKGLSRLMIADDNPATYLTNSLRREYRYDVLSPQATKLRQAIKIHDEQKPDVVLADLYFKESDRASESPSKDIGYKFINHALKFSKHSETPIVLVTSKALLRTDTEIPVGAINCSGASRATDPAAIHAEIWNAARRRGISEAEEIDGKPWGIEYSSRQRLEHAAEDLPMLVEQWFEFGNLIAETLTLCQLLIKESNKEDVEILNKLIESLESASAINDFSLDAVVKIFHETSLIHGLAKEPPESRIKTSIRNILHGKIEQFSSVTGSVQSLQTVVNEVATSLVGTLEFRNIGERLAQTASKFSETDPLCSYLDILKRKLNSVIEELPPLPEQHFVERHRPGQTRKIRIIIVEDTTYWSNYAVRIVRRVANILGSGFELDCQVFDNVYDALAVVPEKTNRFAITDVMEYVPTIAIVDVCLPANKDEADAIRIRSRKSRSSFITPDRENGLKLIETLSNYSHNLPLIVFSTIDSIEDRRTICGWGVPEQNFVSKRYGAERELESALVRFIEKSNRYFVKRYEDIEAESFVSTYWINGVEVKFSNELNETFSAIYNLAQSGSENGFTIDEIIAERRESTDELSKRKIHDHISEIRKRIFETLRKNRLFINVREFLKTRTLDDDARFSYQLNAEVMSNSDEEDYEDDLQNLPYNNRILIIEDDENSRIAEASALESLGYLVEVVDDSDQSLEKAIAFKPDIVSIGLSRSVEGIDLWRRINNELSGKDLGVVLTTSRKDDGEFVSAAVQAGVPLGNLVLRTGVDWLSFYGNKILHEQRRIFLGEIPTSTEDLGLPIVEILDGSDIDAGRLNLLVNSRPAEPTRKSQLASIIGYLLLNPRKLISFESVKSHVIGSSAVSIDDRRNWPQRIRNLIEDDWLEAIPGIDSDEVSKQILESSERGLKLNVQVIDRRIVL